MSVIYFYAANVTLYKIITGRSVSMPVYDNNRWPQDQDNQNVVMLIRVSQAILQAIAIILFYLLLRHYFSDYFSFITAVLVAIYPPLAFFSEALLRENLLLFILMLIAYTFSSYIQKPAYWKLAILGIMWGISALTLQLYMVFGLFMIPWIFWNDKHIYSTMKKCAVLFLFFCLSVSPWLCKVYAFYPDIRIVKSMGCSLTFDVSTMIQLTIAERAKQPPNPIKNNAAPSELPTDKYSYYNDSREAFDNTFNGFYKKQIKERYSPPPFGKQASIYTMNLSRFFLSPGYVVAYGRYMEHRDYRNSFIIIWGSIVLGVFAIVGLTVCIKNIAYLLPVYLFHLAFFWILMSENRRAIPIVPFFILLGIIGLVKVIQLSFPQHKFSIYKDPNLNL